MNATVETRLNSAHRALSSYGARVAILDSLPAIEAAPIGTAMGKLSRFGARLIEAFTDVEKPLVVVADEVYQDIVGGSVAQPAADGAEGLI